MTEKYYLKEVAKLAIPNIISNITIPLLSMVDTMIAGHMSYSYSLAGIAVASSLVNTIYQLWGFLRMATTGLTAQAYGRKDNVDMEKYLITGIVISIVIGIIIYSFKSVFYKFTFVISSGDTNLSSEAVNYMSVIFLGAPAVLLSYTFNGWFIGMQNTKIPMFIAIIANILNILFSILFALIMSMGVKGLALGTVLSQYISILFFVYFIKSKYNSYIENIHYKKILDLSTLKKYFFIGKDLMLRTIMMSSIFLFFSKMGSSYGATTVSANAIVMLMFTIFSYFMDGFAYASEALTGKYIGMQRKKDLYSMIKAVFLIGVFVASLVFCLYFFYCEGILSIMSDKKEVVSEAMKYYIYICLIPIVSFVAFIMDGIFVGATESKELRNTMIISFIMFFISYYSFSNLLGSSALWFGFVVYLSTRSVYQLCVFKKVLDKRF